MQELVEKLQMKLKQYKKMAEDAVSLIYFKNSLVWFVSYNTYLFIQILGRTSQPELG